MIDTDVASELARSAPDANVVAFIAGLDEVIISSIGVFELTRGIEWLAAGKKKSALVRWLAEWLATPVTILAFDAAAARSAANIEASARRTGRGIDVRDLFVLGIAKSHGLTVATRNVAHFRGHGVNIVNPFVLA